MEPIPLIFSCDTEDYETPASDDAELLWATLFRRHGIRACFCVVGEEARALRHRGRHDVLDALAQHEIASHSNMHSAHPTPAEYLDTLSWAEGVRRFVAEEETGVRDLGEILGQRPSAWCKPGNSWGPAVPYGASSLGLPVFCDAPFEWAPGWPLWYAGGALAQPAGAESPDLGGLLLKYHTSFDRYFNAPPGERQAQMRSDFEALLDSRAMEAERAGRPPGYVVMYTHPCRTVTAAFPSNFTAGKNPPRSEWQPSPLRPRGEVDALVADFDPFLGWVEDLRRAGRVALTGYRELFERFRQPVQDVLPLHALMELARALAVDESTLEARRLGGRWLSPAEQFGAVARALGHAAVWGHVPREVPVRFLLGPVDGEDPLPASTGARAATRPPRRVTIGDVQRLAAAATDQCQKQGAVPAAAPLAGGAVGPGRALRLMARGLIAFTAHGNPDGPIQVPEGGDEPALAQRADFQRLRFQNTWSIFPPAFQGQRLIRQARRQTWSAKPA